MERREGVRWGAAWMSGLAMATAWGASATAQTVPSTQSLPSREEIEPPVPEAASGTGVSVDAREAIARPPCPFEGSDLTIALSSVRFQRPGGAPVQPEIAQSLSGVELPSGTLPLRVVCEVRDAANAALRRDGYIASAQIPPQEINSGALTIDIVTARLASIDSIRVRGEPGPYRETLRRRIEALVAIDPLNERDAEQALLLAGDVPGLDVQLSLRPAGTAPGDVIGDLNISYRPWAILANVQNYNSKQLGRETAYLRGEYYGLTGLSDITYAGVQSTFDFDEQVIAQVGHIMGLNDAGTTIGGRFVYAWSRPDIGTLDLRTDTLIAGLDLRHPFVRSVRSSVWGAAGVELVNQDSRLRAGGVSTPFNEDKLRIAYARVEAEFRGALTDGISFSLDGSLEVRKGLGILDATPANSIASSRPGGTARAFVARADASAEIGIGRIFSLAGEARYQWTDDALLNYEEFSLGNLTIGRGYDPGANSGDRALGLRGEVRATLPVPIAGEGQAQLFGFYDHVWLDNLDPFSTEVERTFDSFGGGLRVILPNAALFEVTYASPRDRALLLDRKPPPDRVLVSLTFQLRAPAR